MNLVISEVLPTANEKGFVVITVVVVAVVVSRSHGVDYYYFNEMMQRYNSWEEFFLPWADQDSNFQLFMWTVRRLEKEEGWENYWLARKTKKKGSYRAMNAD